MAGFNANMRIVFSKVEKDKWGLKHRITVSVDGEYFGCLVRDTRGRDRYRGGFVRDQWELDERLASNLEYDFLQVGYHAGSAKSLVRDQIFWHLSKQATKEQLRKQMRA